jgi:hypothetical protein
MTDTDISDAVVFPEDDGTGVPDGAEDYDSAGHFGLLSQHQGGTYVGNGLGFTNVDTTNETVDITTGHAFVEFSSVTVQSGSGTTYDTTLPDAIVMTIVLPSNVTLSLDTDATNDVYLATDPTTNDGAYLRHGSAVTEPTDPSVLLGTVNTADGSTTRASDNASPTFDTVTSKSVNTDHTNSTVMDEPLYREEKSQRWRQLPTARDWTMNPNNPVVTPSNTGSWCDLFTADPWIISDGEKVYLFFEGREQSTYARTGVAESTDGENWTIRSDINPVVDIGHHHAWPMVFFTEDSPKMVVQDNVPGGEPNQATLLETTYDDFPAGPGGGQWNEVGALISADEFDAPVDQLTDYGLVQHNGLWFLLAGCINNARGNEPRFTTVVWNDELSTSGWTETPYSPIEWHPHSKAALMLHKLHGDLFAWDRAFHMHIISELSPMNIEMQDLGTWFDPSESWNTGNGHHFSCTRHKDKWVGTFDATDSSTGELRVGVATQGVNVR